VVDLAAILYAAMTGRWAGYSPSSLPAAPMDQHGPLRPRQVRAGVPRDIDGLCRRVLREEGFDHSLPIERASEVEAALNDIVGDPAHWAPGSIAEIMQSPKDVALSHPRPGESWLHTGLIPVIDAMLGPDAVRLPSAPTPELEPLPPLPSKGLLRPDTTEDTGEVVPGTDRWLFGDEPTARPKPAVRDDREPTPPGGRRASRRRFGGRRD